MLYLPCCVSLKNDTSAQVLKFSLMRKVKLGGAGNEVTQLLVAEPEFEPQSCHCSQPSTFSALGSDQEVLVSDPVPLPSRNMILSKGLWPLQASESPSETRNEYGPCNGLVWRPGNKAREVPGTVSNAWKWLNTIGWLLFGALQTVFYFPLSPLACDFRVTCR